MKRLFIIALSLFFFCFKNEKVINSGAVSLTNNSFLRIAGSTNVNNFSCDLNFSEVNSVVATKYEKNSNKLRFEQTFLYLENTCFDCGNRLMNKDFLDMLKTESYPHIGLDLKEVAVNPRKAEEILAYVKISIAGTSRLFSIPLNIKSESDYKITGCLNLKLSDFNLVPPKKAMGLIVVSDDIEIHFDLNIKPL